jgi:AsmA-like protein/uncharacterized protein DUF748
MWHDAPGRSNGSFFTELPVFLVARRVFLALAVLLGLLVAVIAALPHLVSFDLVRARLLAAAESALHRKVETGAIRLQIFSGLGAGTENVVVHNAPGWETPALLTAEHVSVKLAFWPLLSRRIEIRRIVLEGATATIERDPLGALNVGDFAGAAFADVPPGPPAAVRVSEVVIVGGRLRLVDRKVAPGKTVTTTFDAIQARVAGISAFSASYVELSGRLLSDSQRNFAFKGMLGPPQPGRPLGEMPLDASLSAKGLALARLRPYLGPKSGGAGVLTVETTAKGSFLGTLRLAGSVTLAPRGGRDSQSRIPAIDGRFRGVLDWPHATLTLQRSPLSVARLPLTVQGRIDGLRAKPRLDLELATQGEVPADRVTALPAVAAALPPGMRLSGRVRVTALLRGAPGDLAVHGSATAAPLGLSRDGDSMPLLAAPYAIATLETREGGPRGGRLTISSGALKRVPFANLHADWSWDTQRGTLLVAPEADIYGGRIAARLESELGKAKPLSRATVELTGVRGEALVEAATTTQNAFAGAITGRFSLVSRGLSWDAIQRTARGEGHVTVSGPNLYTVHLKPEVGRMLATLGKYAAGFLTPPSLESTTFDRLDTSLRLAESRLATPDLTLSGRDTAVEAAGSLGLDRTLAYRGHVVLQPSLVRSLGTPGHYIADGDGRVVVPFQVTGTIADPKVSIDTSIIMDLGRRIAARMAGDRLGGWWKVLGDAVGSGALPMPGMGGGFPIPGGGGFPMPPSPRDLLRQFFRPSEPIKPQTPQPTPPATPF